MRKIKKRIVQRYEIMKKHPVTQGRELEGLLRYVTFHLCSSIVRELKYKWINNLKFYARKGDAGIVGNIYYGLYEFHESMLLLHLLRPTDVFLDIGANLGHYSILTSGICSNHSIAIEPVLSTFNQLSRQVELNNLENHITTKKVAIGDRVGELYITNYKGSMNRITRSDIPYSELVQVVPIDDLLMPEIPLVIKIDVEGYELNVLRGAMKTLSNPKLNVLIIELNNSSKHYNITDPEVYQFILKFGFKPYKYDSLKRKLIPLSDYDRDQFNTIFVRNEDYVNKRLKQGKKINIKGRIF